MCIIQFPTPVYISWNISKTGVTKISRCVSKMAAAMDVDTPSGTNSGAGKKRFEVKKWNAVALWAWDIVVDNCAICRNHIMDLCK